MKKLLVSFCCVIILLISSSSALAQIVTTFAGDGLFGGAYGGDGGPATAAHLAYPNGVAIDHGGNVYIADKDNNRIRKVNTSGIITTIAGTGVVGYLGDGGLATNARLHHPIGIAVDPAGNIYFTEWFNNVVRKISVGGVITTVAGNGYGAGIGTGGYSGDGGPATDAELYQPTGIGLDAAGNIYFSDNTNHCVRKVNTMGIITTIAGNGTAGFGGDGGPATASQLSNPAFITIDNHGNIYIPDMGNARVRKINTSGIITTIAGNGTVGFSGDGGPATAAELRSPQGVVLDSMGNIYINDHFRIRKIMAGSGIIMTIASNGIGGYSGDGGPAIAAEFQGMDELAFDNSGNLYTTDFANHRIRMLDHSDHVPSFTGGDARVLGICEDSVASLNSFLAVADSDAGQVITWSLVSGPHHGTATVSSTTVSTGSVVTPTGTSYTPATGYTGNDTFTVQVTDGTLAHVSAFYVTISPCTATLFASQYSTTGSLQLFPSPNNGEFTILAADIIHTVSISNIFGQEVFYNEFNSEKVRLATPDLPSGMYIAKMNGTSVVKFVIR